MDQVLFKFVVLLVLIECVFGAGLLRNRIQTRETNSCEERQAPGVICESCELVSTCIKFDKGWANIPVESCDTQNGYYCNANLGGCSNTTGPCHPFGFEGNFPCTTQGIFPDPYDCQRYHMCYFVESTLVSASVDCGSDKAFNVATGQCSLSLQDPSCHEKQFVCMNAGDAHPWPSNPNIFYVCKATSNQEVRVLYPTLYRCDAGDVFNGFYCISTSTETNTTAIKTTTTRRPMTGPTTNMTNSTTEGSGSTVNNDFECKQRGLLADPENCRMYYYCSGINGKSSHNECPSGTYYNQAISSCTPGACRNT